MTTTAAPDTKYATKIAALFAKAEGTDNEHEREAFTNAALALMAKWGVDDAMAEAAAEGRTGSADPMVQEFIATEGTYKLAWVQLAVQIREGMGTVQLVKLSDVKIAVIGARSDVERFVMLFDLLKPQAEGSMKQWWKPFAGTHTNADGFRHRRQFLLSFATAVGGRLRDQRVSATSEVAGSELVLVDRGQKARVALREFYPRTRTGRASNIRGGGSDARAAGFTAGQRANLAAGRPAIG